MNTPWSARCVKTVLKGARASNVSPSRISRTYAEAVAALNSIQSNFETIEAIRKSGKPLNEYAIPEMVEWCRKIGYQPADFNRLNAVHIAGTKGKGSTSAFISSILTQYLGSSRCPSKIGLYTSPHLRFVRERIRLNNVPLSEQAFADSFFEVWDRLEEAARNSEHPPNARTKPVYFRFLTLMAYHTYLKENADTAIIECGIGGEYDSTNILLAPTVVGITPLGIDHTVLLGSTIEEIAWHKAGIMKKGARAYTVPQPEKAMEVLRTRAKEKEVDLRVVECHPDIAAGNVVLGLAGEFQKMNASLAIEIAATHLRTLGHTHISTQILPSEFVQGLQKVHWSGRCEIRQQGQLTWHLDCGHTVESISEAARWFAGCMQKKLEQDCNNKPNILLFNQQQRAGQPLLRELYDVLSFALDGKKPFTHVIFCSNVTFMLSGYKPDLVSTNANTEAIDNLQVQHDLARIWKELDGPETASIKVVKTIEEAVHECQAISSRLGVPTNVLATGSVHLVGGVLEVLYDRD